MLNEKIRTYYTLTEIDVEDLYNIWIEKNEPTLDEMIKGLKSHQPQQTAKTVTPDKFSNEE